MSKLKPSSFVHNQALLQRFEETLVEAAGERNSEADYEEINQEPEQNQASHGWSQNQEEHQEPWISERSQSVAEGDSRTMSQRDRLQDLLINTKKRASSCFGARMDRIGNASGLGCNNGRGEIAAEDEMRQIKQMKQSKLLYLHKDRMQETLSMHVYTVLAEQPEQPEQPFHCNLERLLTKIDIVLLHDHYLNPDFYLSLCHFPYRIV